MPPAVIPSSWSRRRRNARGRSSPRAQVTSRTLLVHTPATPSFAGLRRVRRKAAGPASEGDVAPDEGRMKGGVSWRVEERILSAVPVGSPSSLTEARLRLLPGGMSA